MSDIEEHCS